MSNVNAVGRSPYTQPTPAFGLHSQVLIGTNQLVEIGFAAWNLSNYTVAYSRVKSRYIHKAEEISEGCIRGAAD